MNKTYFKYLLTSKKGLLAFLALLNFIFPTLAYFIQLFSGVYDNNTASFLVGISSILLFIECIGLPILYFSYIQNKRSVDVYFSLPVDKYELYFTTYLVCVVEIIFFHIVALLPLILSELLLNPNNIHLLYVILYIVLISIMISSITLFASSIIMKCNSLFDSIVMILAYLALPIIIVVLLTTFIETILIGLNSYTYLEYTLQYIFLPASFVLSSLHFTNSGFHNITNYDDSFTLGTGFIIIIIIGVIALLSFLYDSKKRKSEQAEQLSTNLFTYPFIISVVTCSFLLLVSFYEVAFFESIILISIIFIIYCIMGFVYRRKIKMSKRSIILFIVALIFSFSFAGMARVSNGFNLSYLYKTHDQINDIYICHTFELEETYYYIEISHFTSADNIINNKIAKEQLSQKEIMNYIKGRQDVIVQKYYDDNNYYGHTTYSQFQVTYNDKNEYYYTTGYDLNKEYYNLLIQDLKFFNNYNFINFNITKEYTDQNEQYVSIQLEVEDIIKLLSSL